jgi:tetratricopeptide (TPR) repeat protein
MSHKGIHGALLCLAIVSGSGAALAFQQSAPTVRHHRVAETENAASPEVEQAEAAMQGRDLDTAEALLKKAVAADPADYRAWFDLGFVYTQTKRTPDAIDAYRKSVEAKPDVFESNLNLGIVLGRSGDKMEAAKYLKAATQLTPTANADEGLTRAWLTLGLVEESQDPQQALAAYAQASKLSPKNPEPHVSAGQLLEKQEKYDDAVREYQAAAALDPKATEPIAGLANVYSKQKKLPEAEAELRRLLEIDPNNSTASTQLGRVLAAAGKKSEAATALGSEPSKPGGDPRRALDLGTMYVNAGNYAAAEEELRFAVKGLPQDGEAHFALGSLLMVQKQYPEAQQELLIAAKFKPDLSGIYGNLAVVAAANKEYALAIQALDTRAKYLPEIPATYFLRATSYDNLKDRPKAIENYKQFLSADGGKMPDQEWQARHRLIAIDPTNASKYEDKKDKK